MQTNPNGNGTILDGLADIDQCVRNILSCDRGADPFRTDMGIGILTYLDQPITQLGPLKAEIKQQIERWEPRAKVMQVDAVLSQNSATFAVRWAANGEQYTTTVVRNG